MYQAGFSWGGSTQQERQPALALGLNYPKQIGYGFTPNDQHTAFVHQLGRVRLGMETHATLIDLLDH
jgi:hypothetical protein